MKMIQNRAALLAFVLVALAGSFLLLTPTPADATFCPSGGYLTGVNIYYTDSSRTTVSCTDHPCTGSFCTPTPYFRHINICCLPQGQ
jgi:hypothetical protein